MLEVICSNCNSSIKFNFNANSNISCQHCGSIFVIIKTSQAECLTLICAKCRESFTIEKDSLFQCTHKCGSTTYEIRNSNDVNLKKITKNFTIDTEGSYKFVVPYYNGGARIERAIKTWIKKDVVFALCDKDLIPPGAGICSQVFTPLTSKSLGFGERNYPLLKETLKALYDLYPYEDYYGYFNSDIILPQGIQLSHLLPFNKKSIAMHHRVELIGGSEDVPVRNLKEDRVVVVGKDGFVFKREVFLDILEEFPEMIIGIPAWDTALAIWLGKKYGIDNIDLCYKEIKHAHHMTEKTYYDREAQPETEFNVSVYEKVKGAGRITKDRVWSQLTSKSEMEYFGKIRREAKKEIKKIGIIQPRRLGDIIICLPIAKWYFDKGYEVYWPVEEKYISVFDKITYVKPISLGTNEDSYKAAKSALKILINIEIIDLGIGLGRDEAEWRNSKLSFDKWKYKEAKVPFEEKYNLVINRDYVKEDKLKEIVDSKDKQYVVTHSKSSFSKYDFCIPDSIEVKEIEGYDIFDWIGILENADAVFTVDSSVLNLINQLGLCKNKRYYLDWNDLGRVGGELLMPKIENDWQKYEYFEYNKKRYPSYINDGNAKQHIENYALQFCKGKGLDIGGGNNSFLDAEVIDIKNGKDIRETNLIKNKYDYIFSSHFLEHLTSNQAVEVLRKAYEALKPGGNLFLYLPHPDCEYWHPTNPGMRSRYGHKEILYPKEMVELLKELNFEILEYTFTPDYYYSYYIVANKPKRSKKKKKGIVDISFIMIVLNGMPIIKAALKSIEKYASQIIIIEGALDQYKFIAGSDGLSTDGTTEFLKDYTKKNKKVVYLQANDYFQTKQQMHNVALDYVTGDYIWLIDSDEVYHDKDVLKIKNKLKNKNIDQINFRIINFFKSKEYIVNSYSEAFIRNTSNIRRVFKYEKGIKFIAHRPPQVNLSYNNVVNGIDNDVIIYHFSYCLKKQVRDKAKYYASELNKHKNMVDWYHNFFIKWTPENREELEGKEYGCWPPDKKSFTDKFEGELPSSMKDIYFD